MRNQFPLIDLCAVLLENQYRANLHVKARGMRAAMPRQALRSRQLHLLPRALSHYEGCLYPRPPVRCSLPGGTCTRRRCNALYEMRRGGGASSCCSDAREYVERTGNSGSAEREALRVGSRARERNSEIAAGNTNATPLTADARQARQVASWRSAPRRCRCVEAVRRGGLGEPKRASCSPTQRRRSPSRLRRLVLEARRRGQGVSSPSPSPCCRRRRLPWRVADGAAATTTARRLPSRRPADAVGATPRSSRQR